MLTLVSYFLVLNAPVLSHKFFLSFIADLGGASSGYSTLCHLTPGFGRWKPSEQYKSPFSNTASPSERTVLSHTLNFVSLQRHYIKKKRKKAIVLGSDALHVKTSAFKYRGKLPLLHCFISHSSLCNSILIYQCKITMLIVTVLSSIGFVKKHLLLQGTTFVLTHLKIQCTLKCSVATVLHFHIFCIYHLIFYSLGKYFQLLRFLFSFNAK